MHFLQVSYFVLFSIIFIVHGSVSHSPMVRVFFSFTVAKTTRQDASNPNVSSEVDPDIGRLPTARNWARLVGIDMWLSCTVRVWNVEKRAFKIYSFIEPLPGTLVKKIRWGFWTSSFMMRWIRCSRMIPDKLSLSTQ